MVCIHCGKRKFHPEDPGVECQHAFHLSECALNAWEDAEECTCDDWSPE